MTDRYDPSSSSRTHRDFDDDPQKVLEAARKGVAVPEYVESVLSQAKTRSSERFFELESHNTTIVDIPAAELDRLESLTTTYAAITVALTIVGFILWYLCAAWRRRRLRGQSSASSQNTAKRKKLTSIPMEYRAQNQLKTALSSQQ